MLKGLKLFIDRILFLPLVSDFSFVSSFGLSLYCVFNFGSLFLKLYSH